MLTYIAALPVILLSYVTYFWGTPNGMINAKRANIVFIMTDDQDLHLSSMDYMPYVLKHLGEEGTFYKNHYCTISVCCPSRVSLLTGKLAHNTNVTDVVPPYGGYPKFVAQGLNDNYLPVWLQQAGYATYYTGKLMNAHSVHNWNNPFPNGFNHTNFLIDPGTYNYWNATMQSDKDRPRNYPGEYNTDLIAQAALQYLEEASMINKPFFLGIAPIAPHSEWGAGATPKIFTAPQPAPRHKDLFPGITVPRTANFNPDVPSVASWIYDLTKLNSTEISYGDTFYRARLQSLQAVDEMVNDIVVRLDKYKLLNNTYIIYTTDNGFHVGQHRLPPGKTCAIEEDINIPFYVRGPNVPKGEVVDLITSHTDIAPTLFEMAGIELRSDFDGSPIPLTQTAVREAKNEVHRREHVGVEYWGLGVGEGIYAATGPGGSITTWPNNTYKAMRLIGTDYNIMYSVWCTGEHELYDLMIDPGQMSNLLRGPLNHPPFILHRPILEVQSRLDALLMVLKSCKARSCTHPWGEIHPGGEVQSLKEALNPEFDSFYATQPKIKFEECVSGYILGAEGPTNVNQLYLKDGWADWT